MSVAHHDADAATTRVLFRVTALSQLASVVNTSLLLFILWRLHPPSWALLWWGATIAVSLLRYALARGFQRLEAPDAVALRRWRRRAVGGALLAGLTWAGGIGAMLVAAPEGTRAFVAMVAAGVMAGAMPVLSAVPAAFRGFALPIIGAIVGVALFDAHGANDHILALLTVLLGVVLFHGARHYHATLSHSIRLADRLEGSERLFRTLAESASIAIFTYRETFEYMNPAGEQLSGYTLAELRRMPVDAIIHPDDREDARRRIRQRLQDREAITEYEYRIVSKTGAVRWILLHGARVVIDGKPLGVGSAFDITARRDAEDVIRQMAYHDPLTRLPNRRLLTERLQQALRGSEQRGGHGALLMLDLDRFKQINDTEGHDIGDLFLLDVAQRLRRCVRDEDTVARLGGDEYVVLLEDLAHDEITAAAAAAAVAEKIRRALAEPYRLGPGDVELVSSASIGLTLFQGGAHPPEALLKAADLALYQAKAAGRNTVRVFQAATSSTASGTLPPP